MILMTKSICFIKILKTKMIKINKEKITSGTPPRLEGIETMQNFSLKSLLPQSLYNQVF